MSDLPCTWISLKEAQEALGRSEGAVRRLIKRYQIRTRRVVCLKGWELRLAWEDVQKLLPDDAAAAPNSSSAAMATRPEAQPAAPGSPDGHPPAAALQASAILEDFQSTLKAMAQASTSQVELLERLGQRLENAQRERGDVVETQKQFLDSLANISRSQKAQAATLIQVEERLKEQKPRNPVIGWILAILAALLAGFGFAWLLALGPERARAQEAYEQEILRLQEQAEAQEKAIRAEAESRSQRFLDLEKRILEMQAGLESAARPGDVEKEEAGPETATTGASSSGPAADESVRHRQELERQRAELKVEYEGQLRALEEANRQKSFELNHLRLKVKELEEKSGRN
ncbi:MAG: hypothetical protein HYU36_16950 [Planctomycetes bacterium]|nr:hypothetical protein [Planctomycetota bacterium]